MTFTFTSDDTNGCGAVTDDVVVNFNDAVATVNAGADTEVCSDGTVTVMATATTVGGTDVSADGTWSGGAGTFTDNGDGSFTYDPAMTETSGTVTLTFTSNDLNGCGEVSDDLELTINPAVVTVTATADMTTLCPGESAQLTGTVVLADGSTGTGLWDDPAPGTLTPNQFDPNAVFTPAPSQYGTTVTLKWTANDPDGSGPCNGGAFQFLDIIIDAPATLTGVTTDAPDGEVCEGTDVTISFNGLTASTTQTITYNTDGSTDQTATLTSDANGSASLAAMTFAVGNYTATVTSIEIDGCSTDFTTDNDVDFTVKPNPTFTALASDAPVGGVCDGTDVAFTATGLLPNTMNTFDFTVNGDNSQPDVTVMSDANGTVAFPAASYPVGTYTIVLNDITVDGCTTTLTAPDNTITFEVKANPTLSGITSTSATDAVCEGTAIGFSANGLLPGTMQSIAFTVNGDGSQSPVTVMSDANGDFAFPAAQYPAGVYNVVITSITADDCTTTLTQNNTLTFTVNAVPMVDDIADVTVCDSYTLPTITGTDLTGNEAYYTMTGGQGTSFAAGDDITATTTLFIYDETGTDPNCFSEESFTITVNDTPVLDAVADVTACDSYTLPAITGTNLTGNEAYYTMTGGQGTSFAAGDDITTTTTLFVYDATGTTPDCSDEETFTVTINDTPVLDAVADAVACDSYTLPAITGANLTGNEAYYTMTGGQGTSFAAGDDITTTTTLFVYDATGTTPDCSDEETFTVTIVDTPVATAPADEVACEGDMVATIALSSSITGTTFDVSSSADVGFGTSLTGVTEITGFTAANGTTAPVTATVTVTPVFTDNGISCTGDDVTFDITINPTPTFGGIASTDVDDAVCNNEFIGFGVTGLLPNTATMITYTVAANGQTGPAQTQTITTDANGAFDFPASDQYGVGNYTVVITEVSAAGCAITPDVNAATLEFEVLPLPTLSGLTANPAAVCEGNPIGFAVNGVLANTEQTITYTVNGDETTVTVTSDGTDVVFAPEVRAPGTYDIVVTSIEAEGCSTAFTTNNSVTLTVNPNPTIDIPADIELCSGETLPALTFTSDVAGTAIFGSSTGQAGVPFVFQGGFAGTEVVTNNGTTDIVVEVTLGGVSPDGCTANGGTFNITVKPLPVIDAEADRVVCDGENDDVIFSGNIAGATYTWTSDVDFGAGLTGTGDISYTAVNNGTTDLVANVSVTAEANGCTSAVAEEFTITVRPTPTVDPVADIEVCSEGMVAQIDFTGAVAGATFSFENDNSDIGLATSGTGSIPAFTVGTNTSGAAQVATITVTAFVTGGEFDCESTTETFTITVLPEPVAVATPASQTVCSNTDFSVAFTENSGIAGVTSFDWFVTTQSLPIGVTLPAMQGSGDITDAQITNVSGAPVTIDFEVFPSNDNGCAGDAVAFSVTVDPEPVTVATVNTAEVCSEEDINVTFTESSGITGTTTFDWMITTDLSGNPDSISATAMSGSGDITDLEITNISSQPVTVAFSAAGTSADGCAGDDVTFSVVVNPVPVADDEAISGCSVIQLNTDLQSLIDNNVASTFEWFVESISNNGQFVTGATGTMANPNTSSVLDDNLTNFSAQPQTVTYLVTPTGTAGDCEGEAFRVVVTLFGEVSAFFNTDGGTMLCNGNSTRLSPGNPGGAAPYTFTYTIVNAQNGADGFFTEVGNGVFDFTATATGSLNIQLVVTDANNCESEPFTLNTPITITDSPDQPIVTGDTEVCPGSNVTYTVANPVAGVNYTFAIPGVNIVPTGFGQATATFPNFEAGPLNLTVTAAANGCSIESAPLAINVVDVAADFTFVVDGDLGNAGLTYNFTNASVQANSYAWDFDGLGTSTDQNPSFNFPGSGTYEVCLTVDGDCGMDQSCQDVTVTFVPVAACDDVPLANGFNLISTDVTPTNDSIVRVFEDQISEGELIFVQGRNASGQVVIFSPFLPSSLNTLQRIAPGQAYAVSVNLPSTLTVCGDLIDPSFRPALNSGVNLVAYLPQTPADIEDFIGDLFPGNLTLARDYTDGAYRIFNPFFPAALNSLDTARNAKGYELTLSAPVNQGEWLMPEMTSTNRNGDRATNQYMVIAASTNLGEEHVGRQAFITNLEGDVFAIMDVVEGGYLMTTPVYLNDYNVGLEEGTELYVEYNGITLPLGESFTTDARLLYTDLVFEGITPTVTVEETDYELTLAPNPFREQLTLNLTMGQAGKVSVTVTDMTGRHVMTVLTSEQLPAGANTILLPGDNLPAGNYLLSVEVDNLPMFQERILRIK